MAESVYKVIELVGTSPESWEKAAAAAGAAVALEDPMHRGDRRDQVERHALGEQPPHFPRAPAKPRRARSCYRIGSPTIPMTWRS